MQYDTRIYLNHLLKEDGVKENEKKRLIDEFMSNTKVPRTPYNI